MRRLAAITTVGALSLAGLGTAALGPGSTAQAAVPKIAWGECESASLAGLGAQCGFLTVPLDHAKPNGKKIKIAVSRAKADVPAAKRQGVMLVNPGGPGGSGLGMAGLRDVLPQDSGKAYDWIGFDPRGVGKSEPAIACDENYANGPRPNYDPSSQSEELTAEEKAWLARSKKYAAACGKKYGEVLNHLKTIDTVQDMDLLRQALGEKQINYYGFSYGTYLGQVYATKYPQNVRRMVLDGNVNPGDVWYDAQIAQDKAFEKTAAQFFAWVARNDRTYALGTTAKAVRAQYVKALEALRKKPRGETGASEWTDNFTRAMYAEFLWPDTADTFATFVHKKDITAATNAYRGSREGDNGFAVYNAVQCTDTQWPTSSKKQWRPDGFKTAATAPFLTWANVWYNTACLYWPAKAGTPVQVNGALAPGILLINSTLDAATPFASALEVRKRFPKAVLIAEKGATSHSNSLGGNGCIQDRIAAYLLDGTLPARQSGGGADVTCKRTPYPQAGFASHRPASSGDSQAAVAADEGPDDNGSPSSPPETEPGPSRSVPPASRSTLDRIIGLLP
ncbi:MAG: alpha/beta hydrolase [Sporichthyaceae bacterium]